MQKIVAAGVATLILAACGGQGSGRVQESATFVPQRDLTLSPSSEVETQVTSKIELAAVPTAHRSRSSRSATKTRAAPAARATVPVPTSLVAPAPVTERPTPTPAANADPNSHELAPGATVTMIPVSTASTETNDRGGGWSEIPSPRPGGGVTIRGWPGGHCGSGGRGPVSILQ
jgi:hypothetical protein